MSRANLVCIEEPNLNTWAKNTLQIEGDFNKVIQLCVVKVYDEDQEKFKLNQSYEFIGCLNYQPLSAEEEQRKLENIKENGYIPTNEI